MVDIVRLKRDGSVVIPRTVRESMGLAAHESLVLVSDQDTLLLKRLSQIQLRQQLRGLTQTWHQRFKKAKLHTGDVTSEIEAVRSTRR